MLTFYEWRDEQERRYDVMPRWYWDTATCRDKYNQYCERYEDHLNGTGGYYEKH